MSSVGSIYNFIDKIAPFNTAMSFDNVGLLIGDKDTCVKKAVLALDATEDVLKQAVELGAELIITHHPVIFAPLKSLDASSLPYKAVRAGVNVISAHTNYDFARDGVNSCLAKAIGLRNIRPFLLGDNGVEEGIMGDICRGVSITPAEFANHVKDSLGCDVVSYTEGSRAVKTVAVGCGAGSFTMFDAIKAGCDAFVTGESKHHELLAAKDCGITLVTAGHFNTENLAMARLCDSLSKEFTDVEFILAEQSEPVKYI